MDKKEKRVLENSMKFGKIRSAYGKVKTNELPDRIADGVFELLGILYDEYILKNNQPDTD